MKVSLQLLFPGITVINHAIWLQYKVAFIILAKQTSLWFGLYYNFLVWIFLLNLFWFDSTAGLKQIVDCHLHGIRSWLLNVISRTGFWIPALTWKLTFFWSPYKKCPLFELKQGLIYLKQQYNVYIYIFFLSTKELSNGLGYLSTAQV